MGYLYRLRSDVITDDDGVEVIVYGVDVFDRATDKVLKSIPDIFVDCVTAKAFIELCNSEKLNLVHMEDVIEDALT